VPTAPRKRGVVSRRWFLAAFVVIQLALYLPVAFIASGERGRMPPVMDDGPDYDNIAMQLVRGRGFAVDFTDPEWRRPYEQYNTDGRYSELLARRARGPTSYRPPLMPLLLAGTYALFGRSFLAWRLIESMAMAAALALFCSVAWSAFGARVALIAAALMTLSSSYLDYIGYHGLMTETVTVALMALLVWGVSRIRDGQSLQPATFCGSIAALLVLCRSFYVAWLPFLALLVYWLVRRAGADRRRAAASALLCLGLAVAAQVPWWIRNCRLTGAFMPLGTQGGINMYAAYSDLAMLHRGIWWNAPPSEMRLAFARELGHACDGCGEVDLARAETHGARIWIRRHPADLLPLMWWKTAITWRMLSRSGPINVVLWLALAAPLVVWWRRATLRTEVAGAMMALVLLSVLVVALTWSVGWRFMVPVEPLLAILTALVLVAVVDGVIFLARRNER
jgi:4-amino-4-deoxy-L-arabinose transferase-like glycosyltransferase